ncbi:MAG: ribonuclease P protein component [Gemmatimonadota bacterium]|nr:ribonuclease P protein component [Gemmatimonadota bacterium]
MSQEYPRIRRITHRSEFQRLLSKGTRVRTSDLDVRELASPLGYVRVGLVVPKIGQTAVARNTLKRRLRELVRLHLLPLPASCDVAIRCQKSAYRRNFQTLQEQVARIGAGLVTQFGKAAEA